MSEIINLNNTTPAAPSGARNNLWQKDGTSVGVDPVSGYPIYDVSDYMTDMVGDSGSGGEDGLVPAPPSGSAAAGKYLKADATWEIPPSGITQLTGDVTAGPGSGSQVATLTSTAVTPGSYTNTNLTVDAKGRLTAASNGTVVTPTQVQQESLIYAADTGSANAYAVSLSPAPTIVAGSVVVFKAVHANTGPSTLAVNGGSATPIYKEVSTPLASGDILAGQIVTVIYDGTNWQIAATGALPAGTLVPALRGTADGNGTTGSSFTVTWPSGTVAGDLVVICCNHDYNLTNPSGWTQDALANGLSWNGLVCSKVMTSGDISTGSVTISAAGSQDWAYIVTAFIGATGGIRETDFTDSPGGSSTLTVTTSGAVIATDAALYYGTGRQAGTTVSVSRGTLALANTGTNSKSVLYTESLTSSGAISPVFSYTLGGNGCFAAVVIVEGVPLAAVVTSLNGLTGALTLAAGSNVTITPSGTTLTIAASGGGGSPGGSSGQIQYNNSGAFGGFTVSGDGTLVPSTGDLTITKTSGVAFAPSATTDTTNATNITSGTLPAARLPLATTGAFGAVKPDGSSITISAGVISASGSLTNPMTTEGDIIYGGTSGTPTRLAAGTSGNVLQTNGSGAAPTWVSAGGGGSGALILVEEHTASSSSSLDFTTGITSTYDEYVVEMIGIIPATNAAAAMLLFSTNGGSSYDTSSIYDWSYDNCQLGGGGGSKGGAAAVGLISLCCGDGILAAALPGLVGSFRLFAPLSASNQKLVIGQATFTYSGDSNRYMFTFAGDYKSTTAVNAFRIIMSSGNIASGTVRCYGLTH